jgi:hypothetical protein
MLNGFFKFKALYLLTVELWWGLEVGFKRICEDFALFFSEITNKNPTDPAIIQKVQKSFSFRFEFIFLKDLNGFINIWILIPQNVV